MYFVYILQSINADKFYVGYTSNLERRLLEHQSGNSVFDRTYRPFRLVFSEKYENKLVAMRREREIKSYKGGNSFKNLVGRTPR